MYLKTLWLASQAFQTTKEHLVLNVIFSNILKTPLQERSRREPITATNKKIGITSEFGYASKLIIISNIRLIGSAAPQSN